MKKLIFSLIMIIGFILSSQAQSEKTKTKINRKIEKINVSIVQADSSAALTSKQREEIFSILLKSQKNIIAIKKAHKNDENLKELIKIENKKALKKINKKILTKQQRQAKKMAKAINPYKL